MAGRTGSRSARQGGSRNFARRFWEPHDGTSVLIYKGLPLFSLYTGLKPYYELVGSAVHLCILTLAQEELGHAPTLIPQDLGQNPNPAGQGTLPDPLALHPRD